MFIVFVVDPESAMNPDVSILVTDASPEVPNCPNINSNQTLIHHVIVHRESEEYHELEEVVTDQPSMFIGCKLIGEFTNFGEILDLKFVTNI